MSLAAQTPSVRGRAGNRGLVVMARELVRRTASALGRHQGHRDLGTLSECQLRDVGLTRTDVLHAGQQGFSDAATADLSRNRRRRIGNW